MSVKKKYNVKSIKAKQTYEWILYKHYAKRIPSISFSFGLFNKNKLIGICTFGKPASPTLCNGVCGIENSKFVYELNRLCVDENLGKNVLSFFVSNCLKLLPIPKIIVSYSDTKFGHNGYIYQSTNWIYTGATKERTDIGSDDNTHSRHYDKNIDYSKNRVKRSSKHRYIYFLGKKNQIKKMKNCLKYTIEPYPKGANKRYDCSYKTTTQTELF